MSNTEHGSLGWVESVPQRLKADKSKALRIDRSGYVAFITHGGGYSFDVMHRHYHEDDWREESIGQESLIGSAARFSSQAEIVDMPDLEDVEVVLNE